MRSCVDARERVLDTCPSRIMGADAHAGAAGLARDGIANAGVEDDVTIQVADCLEWTPHINRLWSSRTRPGMEDWRAPTRPGRL